MGLGICHDCGAVEGQYHHFGCDMEECPFCGHQLLSCDCCYELLGIDVSEGTWAYKNGLTNGYNRIVHGGRGAYVEFLDEQMVKENLVIPEGSEWRLDPDHPVYHQCYFVLHNPKGEKTRVYHQRKTVDYADYVVGRWYIAPKGLQGFEVVGRYDNK